MKHTYSPSHIPHAHVMSISTWSEYPIGSDILVVAHKSPASSPYSWFISIAENDNPLLVSPASISISQYEALTCITLALSVAEWGSHQTIHLALRREQEVNCFCITDITVSNCDTGPSDPSQSWLAECTISIRWGHIVGLPNVKQSLMLLENWSEMSLA